MKMTKAFTIIELIFVIVILGILSAIALPKFAGIKKQADIVNAKAQVSTIRAAIANDRQRRLIMGCSLYARIGSSNFKCSADGKSYVTPGAITDYKDINNGGLFGGVLTTALTDADTDGNWHATGVAGQYTYKIDSVPVVFTYSDSTAAVGLKGTFTCDDANATYGTECGNIIN